MRFQKTICAALVTAILSGCASTSNQVAHQFPKDSAVTERAAAEQMSATWNNDAVVREGKPMLVLVTPFSVPNEVRTKQIRLELESGATVKDLVAVMGNLGYSIILADKDAGEKQFFLPHYNGTVGNLLNTVARATDVWFTWSDGTIVVSSNEKVSVTLPQEEGIATKVSEGLKGLGLDEKNTSASWEAGMVTLAVTPSQLAKVRAFLQRMTNNAALVSLQVAILNVTLDQNAKQGIDWTKLQLMAGSKYAPAGEETMDSFHPTQGNSGFYNTQGQPVGSSSTSSTGTTSSSTSSSSTTASTTASTVVDEALSAVGMAGGGLKGIISTSAFSFTGMFDFLQTYGQTDTKQNVVLKTIAGTTVELKSLTETPYVESISVTTTGNGSGTAGAVGSAKTAKADDGLALKLTPTYDAAANTVTVKMDMSLKAVLGFNTLSAGAQIGTLSQPTTADRSFNDVLRVRPGQTVVVGGLVYDSVASDGNNPNFVDENGKYAHKDLTVTRNSMFIVIRPTVTSLGQVTQEGGTDLFAPAQEEQPPVKAAPARPHKSVKPKAVAKAKSEEDQASDAKTPVATPSAPEASTTAKAVVAPATPAVDVKGATAMAAAAATVSKDVPAVAETAISESAPAAVAKPVESTPQAVALAKTDVTTTNAPVVPGKSVEPTATLKDAKPTVVKSEPVPSYDADGYASVPLRAKE